jgi:hypothetical protein
MEGLTDEQFKRHCHPVLQMAVRGLTQFACTDHPVLCPCGPGGIFTHRIG